MLAKLNLYDYSVMLCFLTSVACFQKLRQTALVWFVPLLALTLVVEWGSLFRYFQIHGSNHWIFNILTTIEFSFYFYLFQQALRKIMIKRISFTTALFFPVAVLSNCFFLQGFNHFHTNTYIVGSLLIILFACSYFYQLLQTPKQMKLFALPFFWIATGLFFFYAGQFVIMAIFPHLVYAKDKAFTEIFHAIVYNLNIFLYCCFIIAFLCQHKTTNSFT